MGNPVKEPLSYARCVVSQRKKRSASGYDASMRWIGLIVVLLSLYGCYVSNQGQTPAPSPRPKVSADAMRAFGQAVNRSGYSCPDVKDVWPESPDINGQNAKVLCGETHSPNTMKDRIFRVTIRPNDKVEVRAVGLYD